MGARAWETGEGFNDDNGVRLPTRWHYATPRHAPAHCVAAMHRYKDGPGRARRVNAAPSREASATVPRARPQQSAWTASTPLVRAHGGPAALVYGLHARYDVHGALYATCVTRVCHVCDTCTPRVCHVYATCGRQRTEPCRTHTDTATRAAGYTKSARAAHTNTHTRAQMHAVARGGTHAHTHKHKRAHMREQSDTQRQAHRTSLNTRTQQPLHAPDAHSAHTDTSVERTDRSTPCRDGSGLQHRPRKAT